MRLGYSVLLEWGNSSYFNNYTFPLNTKIPANGYFVVARDTALFHAQYPTTTKSRSRLTLPFVVFSVTRLGNF